MKSYLIFICLWQSVFGSDDPYSFTEVFEHHHPPAPAPTKYHPKLQPGPWLKEVELKTATSDHAEMDDDLSFEICNYKGNCCFFKVADFPYNQYEKGLVETFKYGQLKRCRNFEIEDLKSVRVDHYGEDGWQGEYVKLFTDSGPDYFCPITKFLDNSDHENLSCKRLEY